jgi:hypothetical protein
MILLQIINEDISEKELKKMEEDAGYSEDILEEIDGQNFCCHRMEDVTRIYELLEGKLSDKEFDSFIRKCEDELSILRLIDKRMKLENYFN